jgi:hypothetical protein
MTGSRCCSWLDGDIRTRHLSFPDVQMDDERLYGDRGRPVCGPLLYGTAGFLGDTTFVGQAHGVEL